MENYNLIAYARHKVPEEIYNQFNTVINESLQSPNITSVYKYDNIDTKSKYQKLNNDEILDLYLNLKSAISSVASGEICFLVEYDVLYPEEHFTNGINSIQKEPSFIHSNSNFVQKASGEDFRKYPSGVNIFSSLCGKREALLTHIDEKIKEFNSEGKVMWLEPGYHLNGRSYFVQFKSDYPCIELRHGWSSTQLGSSKSHFIKILEAQDSMTRKTIGVMCPLKNFTASYSVAKCVYDQLCLLSRKYSNVVFITTDNFADHKLLPESVELRTIPTFLGDQSAEKCSLFSTENKSLLANILSDIDILITHDIIFIDGYKPYNSLLRLSLDNNELLKMIHYIHSAPSVIDRTNCVYPEILCREPMKNSKYVCLNKENVKLLSEMYMADISEIIFVPNSIDPCINYNFHPISKEIYYEYNLWDYDIVCVYPARIAGGKQQTKLVRLLSEINNMGIKTCLILLGSATAHAETPNYINSIKEIAKKYKFEDNLILSSEIISAWCHYNNYPIEDGVPHEVSINLMQLCDLFILPSVSEGCSLIMLEAAMAKNAIILNDDLPTLKDFGGNPKDKIKKSHFISFGSIPNPKPVSPTNEEWEEKAKSVISAVQSNSSLNFFRYVRKYHSPDYIFNMLLSPHMD